MPENSYHILYFRKISKILIWRYRVGTTSFYFLVPFCNIKEDLNRRNSWFTSDLEDLSVPTHENHFINPNVSQGPFNRFYVLFVVPTWQLHKPETSPKTGGHFSSFWTSFNVLSSLDNADIPVSAVKKIHIATQVCTSASTVNMLHTNIVFPLQHCKVQCYK